jgi:hypothetical protein
MVQISSNAWARQIYLSLRRALELGSYNAPGPVAVAVAVVTYSAGLDCLVMDEKLDDRQTVAVPLVWVVNDVPLAGSAAARRRFQDRRAVGIAAAEGGQSDCPRRPGAPAVQIGQTEGDAR